MGLLASLLLVFSSPVIAFAGWRIAWCFPAGRRFIVDVMSTDDTRADNLADLERI